MIQRYSEFRPTSFDVPGLSLDDRQNWLVVPVSQTRDSGPFDQSNFAVALDILGGESDTVEVHRFGHWGPGWFEIIIVDPARMADVEGIEASLESYPVLSDDDFSEREFNEYVETWNRWGEREFRRGLERRFEPELTDAELETLEDIDLMTFYESQFPGGGYYEGESDGVSLPIDRALKSVRLADLRALLSGGNQ